VQRREEQADPSSKPQPGRQVVAAAQMQGGSGSGAGAKPPQKAEQTRYGHSESEHQLALGAIRQQQERELW
jgi:hypothetical protein